MYRKAIEFYKTSPPTLYLTALYTTITSRAPPVPILES